VRVEPVGDDDRAAMRKEWGLADSERVVLGGSTWPGEEAALLDAFGSLLASHPDLRVLLAPRHLERLEEVLALIRERNLPFATRTGRREGNSGNASPPVLVLDTIGELARTYAIAEIAFVGKSLTEIGGQNPLEPAGQGVAVLFGPNMQNFRDIAPGLVNARGAVQIERAEDLGAALESLLSNSGKAREMGRHAREFVEANAGVAARTAEEVMGVMG